MTSIKDALAKLDARVKVTRGQPASPEEIAALEKHAKTSLPAEYKRFLEEYGALQLEADLPGMYGDLRFLGHAPGNEALDVTLAIDAIPDEFERWGQEPVPVAPVLVFGVSSGGNGDPGSECTAVANGKVVSFWRGRLEDSARSFDALFVEWAEAIAEQFHEAEGKHQRTVDFLGALQPLVPPEHLESQALSGGRLVVVRPSDGAKITIRMGDGREYREAGQSGVFVSWFEPAVRTLEEMNDWNRQAIFVRGSALPDRTRFRGRLLVNELEPARFLEALEHDASLPRSAPSTEPVTLERVQEILSEVHTEATRKNAKFNALFAAKVQGVIEEKRAEIIAAVDAKPPVPYDVADAFLHGPRVRGLSRREQRRPARPDAARPARRRPRGQGPDRREARPHRSFGRRCHRSRLHPGGARADESPRRASRP